MSDVEIKIGANAAAVTPATNEAAAGIGNVTKAAEQSGAALTRVNRQAAEAASGLGRLGARFGLTANEARNMTYQLNDVAVSLAGGMSPMTVFMQQGSQMGQILGTSQGGVGAALRGLVGLITPTTIGIGVLATAVGIGAASWIGYVQSVDRMNVAVTGAGRALGVTGEQLMEVANQAAAAGNISESAGQSMATSFARTGAIGTEMMGNLIQISRDYQVAMGVDAEQATRDLGRAFADPVAGADTLDATLHILDATTRQHIEDLQRQGDFLGAQRALFEALQPAIAGARNESNGLAQAWANVTVWANNAAAAIGRAINRSIEFQATGGDQFAAGLSGLGGGPTTSAGDAEGLLRAMADGKRAYNASMADSNRRSRQASDTADRLDPWRARSRDIQSDLTNLSKAIKSGAIDVATGTAAWNKGMISLITGGQRAQGVGATPKAKAPRKAKAARKARTKLGPPDRSMGDAFELMQREGRLLERELRERGAMLNAAAQQAAGIRSSQMRATNEIARADAEFEISQIDRREQRGELSATQAVAARNQVNERIRAQTVARAEAEYAIERDLLDQQYQAALGNEAQRAEILARIRINEQEHVDQMRVINHQLAVSVINDADRMADAVRNRWNGIISPIVQSMGQIGQQLIQRQITWGQAWNQLLSGMLSQFTQWCVQIVTQWAVAQVAKTGATAAGEATRTGLEASSMAASIAMSAWGALVKIGHLAAVAAAGAWAALASIPIIGPILAPAAAIAALAGVLALGKSLFSAEQGWGNVPYDGATTQLHRQEMVLPAKYAVPLRAQLERQGSDGGGGGGGGLVNNVAGKVAGLTINALDAHSFEGFMRRRGGRVIERWLRVAHRNGARITV